MKVWIKLFIGSILGVSLGLLLPGANQELAGALDWLEALAVRIGRYALIPMLVFSLTIAIYELRRDGGFWPLILRSFLAALGSGGLVIALGIIATLAFPPSRIPILVEEQVDPVTSSFPETLMELFPSNMFSVLAAEGTFLLPLCVFAFFFAMGLSYDRSYTKPVIALVDSLSRIFYHVASFFSEILGVILIVLSASWTIRYREVLATGMFRDLVILLGVLSLVLGLVVLPLLLLLLRPKVNPWAVVYGSLGPAFTAFFSGDMNFTLPVALRHIKENLGARRRSNMVSAAFFSIFGRSGSAMVAAAAFIVIIKSYSSLEISMADVFSIGMRALLISFALAQHPGDGAYIALAMLSLGYGGIFRAGYLILKPLAFYLIAVGTFLDMMILSFASYALSRISGFQEEKSLRHFI